MKIAGEIASAKAAGRRRENGARRISQLAELMKAENEMAL
jgi:hypothetical protein